MYMHMAVIFRNGYQTAENLCRNRSVLQIFLVTRTLTLSKSAACLELTGFIVLLPILICGTRKHSKNGRDEWEKFGLKLFTVTDYNKTEEQQLS